mmetsp:Transcript_36702/g.79330  ORF Transcript_36702/g.79330 Transcript_36702/m.79330 type:complete len:213 (+) Transcript_36702:81-719(+)
MASNARHAEPCVPPFSSLRGAPVCSSFFLLPRRERLTAPFSRPSYSIEKKPASAASPASMHDVRSIAPVKISGEVIKGFGRGSKLLGCPTANLPLDAIKESNHLDPGVYCGWASVSGSGPFKMVMSLGWNPYFQNKEKTVEPHLIHEFAEDFYGQELRLVICAFLRPEANFPALDDLIAAINQDIKVAKETLDTPDLSAVSADEFLQISQKP